MASHLSSEDRGRISQAVSTAEAQSSGEIVTILADRSDGYTDIALAWAVVVAFAAIAALSVFPDVFLGLIDDLTGAWANEWTAREIFAVAGTVGAVTFIAMVLLQLWSPLKFALIPGAIKSARTRDRAITCFKVGAERRTTGRTGVLIYLSMREHHAEILADRAIAAKVSEEVWGEAMAAMIGPLRDGRTADGMIAAVDRVGQVLAAQFPRSDDDVNELPDRLIEV